MTYVSWAVLYEGPADQAYFDVLIPRVLEDITLRHGIRTTTIPPGPAVTLSRGTVDDVAKEACAVQDAFHIVFIHSDTGGRNLELSLDARSDSYCRAMNNRCNWSLKRCITITPRHETEAWVLADPDAIRSLLGFSGSADSIGLPNDAQAAERLVDPKAALEDAVRAVRGSRRLVGARQIYPAIAQRQSLEFLRRSPSFLSFESKLKVALADIGCISC